MGERETGKVKWFSNAKGYGFIERPEGGDVFVHFSFIRGEGFKRLAEGQRVDYVVIQGEKGPEARDVGIAEAEIAQTLKRLQAASTTSGEVEGTATPASEMHVEEAPAVAGATISEETEEFVVAEVDTSPSEVEQDEPEPIEGASGPEEGEAVSRVVSSIEGGSMEGDESDRIAEEEEADA